MFGPTTIKRSINVYNLVKINPIAALVVWMVLNILSIIKHLKYDEFII